MNRPLTSSKQRLIKNLRGKIRQVETISRNDDGTIVSSGSADIDAMLPGGGYHRGTIVEWLADRGSSAEYLSLLTAQNAAHDGGAIVVVDSRGDFFPPAARAIGINLGNLIVLKGSGRQEFSDSGSQKISNFGSNTAKNDEDFLWAIDQSLRCAAVAAVWGSLPNFKTPLLAERWLRRFQLSAETSGCLGLFIRNQYEEKASPLNACKFASWSEIQWHLRPRLTTHEHTRTVRALLTRCRGGIAGRAIDLEINLVTGNVQCARREHATRRTRHSHPLSLAAQLANPKIGRRAERA